MSAQDARRPRERRRRTGREARHRSREAALQMLYQWEVGRTDVDEVVRAFWAIERPGETGATRRARDFAEHLVRGTVTELPRIDPLIVESAEHWRLSRMAVIDRLILRLAVYEFLATETPRKVVINEALELARTFSSGDAIRFVNGILDGIKRRLEDEASMPGPQSSEGSKKER